MSERFYVFGGAYMDTQWKQLISGTAELHGPFPSHDMAERVWRGRAFATVDFAYVRFQVVPESKLGDCFAGVGGGRLICETATIEGFIAALKAAEAG